MTVFLIAWTIGFIVITGWLLLLEANSATSLAFREILYEHERKQGRTHQQAVRSTIFGTAFVIGGPAAVISALIAGVIAITW